MKLAGADSQDDLTVISHKEDDSRGAGFFKRRIEELDLPEENQVERNKVHQQGK